MTTKVKHPQFILAIAQSYFSSLPEHFKQGINRYPAAQWLEEAQPHLVIKQRNTLETDPTYRQLLPYVIVTQKDSEGATKFLAYRRTSQVGESRLAGNVSIGYGGHVDLDDVAVEKSVIALDWTLRLSAYRELKEELELVDLSSGCLVDTNAVQITEIAQQFILDDTNEVGKVHVGIIVLVELPSHWSAKSGEDELEAMEPMSAAALLASGLPLENWTRIYLESLA